MKATSVEVYPVYKCGGCGRKNKSTIAHTQKIKKILCVCGNVIRTDPIQTFRVDPVYATKKKTVKDISRWEQRKQDIFKEKIYENVHDDIEDEILTDFLSATEKEAGERSVLVADKYKKQAIDAMVGLGWKKRKAAAKVSNAIVEWNGSEGKVVTDINFGDFLKHAMSG